MKKFIKKNLKWITVILIPLLMTFSFTPFSLWPLSFICFFPLFYLIEVKNFKFNLKYAIGMGALLGISISIFAFQWLVHTIEVYGHLPKIIAVVIFLLYAIAANIRYIIFFLLILFFQKYIEEKHLANKWYFNRYLFFALSWGFCEHIGWQLFPVFGANLAGSNLIFLQISDIVGIKGLSILWFFIGHGFFNLITHIQNKNKITYQKIIKKPFAIALITFLLIHIYGFISYKFWYSKQNNYASKNVAVIQANSPLSFKSNRSRRVFLNQNTKRVFSVARDVALKQQKKNKKIDLLVLPEGTLPYASYKTSFALREQIKLFHETSNADVILNDILYQRKKFFSNMSIYNKEGSELSNYQKVYLLPFGEYMPMAEVFPFLQEAFREVSNFTHGSKFELFQSSTAGTILPVVCYEIIQSEFLQNFYSDTKAKAQLLVNITNDTWFGNSQESMQHLELGKIRAIELRRPIVRATNSGVSSYIDILGNTKDKSKLFNSDEKVYQVKIANKNHQSIFSLIGYLPLYLIFSCFLIIIGIALFNIGNNFGNRS